ncbi:hypothetical protein EMPG_11617 [Blastomyces silverae]|uniref:Uncharacterized protein n=1 Tax=Blastomyces silverae TaxID=2060906 RepID=A0A0H1BQX1_9EURO|nr:hypothetical protein EMPG_11617 [Blastomyces silverae]
MADCELLRTASSNSSTRVVQVETKPLRGYSADLATASQCPIPLLLVSRRSWSHTLGVTALPKVRVATS